MGGLVVGIAFLERGIADELRHGSGRKRRQLQQDRGDHRLRHVARFERAGRHLEAGKAASEVIGGEGVVGQSQGARDLFGRPDAG